MRRMRTSGPMVFAMVVLGSVAAQQSGSPVQQSIQDALQPNPLQGSVSQEKATADVMQLTLQDAIRRALRYNLALINSDAATQQVRAEQLRQLANLLPNISASVTETAQQNNLAAFGFPVGKIPGIQPIVGPFVVFDARANLSQTLVNWNQIEKFRAARESTKGAVQALRNNRELVVLATGNSYLQVTSALSRVEAAQAELTTAQTLFQRAQDQERAGVTPNIDTLRAQVQLQLRQQQLISAQNDYDKAQLQLARTIGLPLAQRFQIVDRVPYQPLPPLQFEAEVQRAYQRRADYQQAEALVKAADLSRKAAVAEHYPSLGVQGYYGDEGLNSPAHSHGVFNAQAGLQIPIFAGGRVRADIREADATLKLREAARDDLKTRIEYEIRQAFLDVQSAAKLVEASQTNLNVANETLKQAQDRFSAGVADNLEVVQAQDSVASANDSYISAVYQHNLAKVFLARSVGVAEDAVEQYLKGTSK